MRHIQFDVELFRTPESRKASEVAMRGMLAGLCIVNMSYLRTHPNTPALYESGVRYRREPMGEETWQDIPNLIARGYGDCEDLACWLVADRRVRQKIRAKPHLTYRKDGNLYRYHVTVVYPNGLVEDPSRKLGM